MGPPVRLEPLGPETLAPVQALRVKPFQTIFSGDPATFMTGPEDGYDPHVILLDEDVIGMFRIDRTFHLRHTFASSDTMAVSNMLIAADRQGSGYGTAACRQMASYLKSRLGLVRGVHALVHTRNEAALRAFQRGGWTDTGTEHGRDPTGPQKILWMPLG